MKLRKRFILMIPDEVYFRCMEETLIEKWNMTVESTGCGSTEFGCDKKPSNFDRDFKKLFGNIIFNHIRYQTIHY